MISAVKVCVFRNWLPLVALLDRIIELVEIEKFRFLPENF